MERDVRLIAHNPTIMPWRDIEDVSRFHFEHPAIVHGRSSPAGDDHPDMLHAATRGPGGPAYMHRPFPARFVGSAADSHAAQPDHFEFALLEGSHFIRLFESLEDHFQHGLPSSQY